MIKTLTRSLCNLQNVHIIKIVSILYVILCTIIIVPAESHAIRPKREIIESVDRINIPISNNTDTNDSPYPVVEDIEDIHSTKDETDTHSIEIENENEKHNKTALSTTTDVANVIEENFDKQPHRMDAHVNKQSPVENNISENAANISSTKEISHDSHESVANRLPLNSNEEKTESTTQNHNAVTMSTNGLTLEKTKRLDASIQNSTDRTVNEVDTTSTSTVASKPSSVTPRSVQSQTPRIGHASETIRARVTLDQLKEKQAKYLSDPHPSTATTPLPSTDILADPLGNIKIVDEVNHNNFTFARANVGENPIKSVNGKIDHEELTIDKPSVEATSTEKVAEEHETHLQKQKIAALNVNSSRINENVQHDNSLTSLQLASDRPTSVITPKTSTAKSHQSHEEMRQDVKIANVEHESSSTVSQNTLAPETTTKSISTNKPIVETATESGTSAETETTTETDTSTTVADPNTSTVSDTMTTLGLNPTELKGNLSTTTEPQITTEAITESTETEPTSTHISTSTKQMETTAKSTTVDETQQKAKIVTRSTTISPTTFDVVTPPMIKHPSSTSHESIATIVSTTSEKATKFTINDELSKLNTPKHQTPATRQNAEQSVPSTTTTTTTTTTTQTSTSTETTEKPSTNSTPESTSRFGEPRDAGQAITPPIMQHPTEPATKFDDDKPTDVNAMIAIVISIVAVITLILLVGFLFVMRKRQKQLTYGQRCRPIGLDAYSLDNVSVYNSVRRKSAIRTSKRAFGNAGFDDPSLKNNPLTIQQLATFSHKRVSINDEFREIPLVTARIEEVPIGCEEKNRYANVVPLPESRVHLKQLDDDEKTEYINANFVKGPKDTTHYYIACQAPLEHTVTDFWRMIWEQNSRVIIMATDLTENGIEKCAEYLPSSFVIDNHVTFGDYQIILKNREVRDKYAVSTVHLKNACTKTWREITHFWYQWPENGVPTDEASVIAMLLEARSYLKTTLPERNVEGSEQESDLCNGDLSNGNLDKSKSLQKVQGPLTVHCSPGTGRTGTIIGCDIAIRSLEQPTRMVDIPQIVYFVRRGRASAVQTREQYEFIYKVAHVYATKLTGPVDN